MGSESQRRPHPVGWGTLPAGTGWDGAWADSLGSSSPRPREAQTLTGRWSAPLLPPGSQQLATPPGPGASADRRPGRVGRAKAQPLSARGTASPALGPTQALKPTHQPRGAQASPPSRLGRHQNPCSCPHPTRNMQVPKSPRHTDYPGFSPQTGPSGSSYPASNRLR